MFDIAEESSKILLEIITVMSSVNKMGSDKVFIVYCWKYVICIYQEKQRH
jgi:hypothetical protein